MSRPAIFCARRKHETAASYCSRQRELTIASRKLLRPSTAVYQAGRGSEPMIEVGRATPTDALYIVSSLVLSPGSQIVSFALQDCVFRELAVRLPQRRTGIAEAVDDRVAAVAAEILQRHLDAGRRLPALVLGKMQHALDLHDCLAVEAFRHDLGDRLLALDQTFEDLIEHIVRRQRVLVGLVLAQLRAGRTRENAVWDHRAVGTSRAIGLPGVAQPREPIDLGLVEILDRIETAVHVAIERGVADRHFRFI